MITDLKKDLVGLRLRGIAENIEFRLQQAKALQMTHTDFLGSLIEDEQIRRSRKSYEKRLAVSDLKESKTLENYDFNLQPSINKDLVLRLATCEFVANMDKLIILGISGIGKSHLVNALGLCALAKGFTVYRYNANDLANQLLLARKEKTYDELFRKIMKADLLIIDEFAMRSFPDGGTDELFALLEKVDESLSVAITSNREFQDWNVFFSDQTIASAFTDRAVNNAILIKVETGVSERQKSFERKNASLL